MDPHIYEVPVEGFEDWILDDTNTYAVEDLDDALRVVHPGLTHLNRLEEHAETSISAGLNKTWKHFLSLFRNSSANVPNLLAKENFPELISAIRSMVGDDETITSNSLFYNLLCVLIGESAAKIKISWGDVGFSKDVYNYAEGWVLLPPSKNSSFEAVTKYARGTGVPFVLDPVKLKNLSAVRKQSEMERDLPSKFRNLAEAAAWTNPSWPTYNLHQFALLLGIELFDFMRSKLFPYLFKTEGGCGGPPPWGNLHTVAGALFRYRRGRAQKGVLGIITETNALFDGSLRPKDSLFVKNLALAMSGDARWEKIRGHMEAVKQEQLKFDGVYLNQLDQASDDLIPDEIREKGATIYPEDLLTGSSVSFLREKGYIYTELDVVMRLEERKRLDAVWGIIPMREIEDQVAARKKEYQDAFLETLTVLSEYRKPHPSIGEALEMIKSPFDHSSISAMAKYYAMRVQQNSHITSFIYNDRLRVFKAEDIEAYFDKGMAGIRDQFAQSVESLYRPDFRRSINLPEDEDKWDAVEKWLHSKPLEELLKGKIPPGAGPDDSRIARDIIIDLEDRLTEGWEGLLILVVTSDRRLVHNLATIVGHQFPTLISRIIQLPVQDYIRGIMTNDTSIGAARVSWILGEKLYDVFQQMNVPIRGPLYRLLCKQAPFFYSCKKKACLVYYDYPNINRTTARLSLTASYDLVERTGGFLTRSYLDARKDFSILEMESVKGLHEFRVGIRKKITPLADLAQQRAIRVYSPRDLGETFERPVMWSRPSQLSIE